MQMTRPALVARFLSATAAVVIMAGWGGPAGAQPLPFGWGGSAGPQWGSGERPWAGGGRIAATGVLLVQLKVEQGCTIEVVDGLVTPPVAAVRSPGWLISCRTTIRISVRLSLSRLMRNAPPSRTWPGSRQCDLRWIIEHVYYVIPAQSCPKAACLMRERCGPGHDGDNGGHPSVAVHYVPGARRCRPALHNKRGGD